MAHPAAVVSQHPHAPSPDGKTHNPLRKFRNKIDEITTDVSRLGVAISTTLNPNHRHDEAWEKERDTKLEAIRDGHRFRSFAGERDGEASFAASLARATYELTTMA